MQQAREDVPGLAVLYSAAGWHRRVRDMVLQEVSTAAHSTATGSINQLSSYTVVLGFEICVSVDTATDEIFSWGLHC